MVRCGGVPGGASCAFGAGGSPAVRAACPARSAAPGAVASARCRCLAALGETAGCRARRRCWSTAVACPPARPRPPPGSRASTCPAPAPNASADALVGGVSAIGPAPWPCRSVGQTTGRPRPRGPAAPATGATRAPRQPPPPRPRGRRVLRPHNQMAVPEPVGAAPLRPRRSLPVALRPPARRLGSWAAHPARSLAPACRAARRVSWGTWDAHT